MTGTELLPGTGTIVLTGAGGWFGRSFLHELASGRATGDPWAGEGEVRALVAHPDDVPGVLAALPQASVHVGDLTDQDIVERLLRGASDATLVHAAAVIHPRRISDFERVNHHGTRTLVGAAGRAKVRRLVHLSSNSPFGVNATATDVFRHDEPYDPYLGYGWSKMRAELVVEEAHRRGLLDTVVVRPPWFYGPFQPMRQTTFFRMVRTGRFPLLGDGRQRRAMVHTQNLVQGVLRSMRVAKASGQAFWIADQRPYEMREVLETVKRALREEGYEVSRHQVVVPALLGRVAEGGDRLLQARGRYWRELHVLGESDKTIACDITRSTEVLGYRPTVALMEGMRQAIRWCRSVGVEL